MLYMSSEFVKRIFFVKILTFFIVYNKKVIDEWRFFIGRSYSQLSKRSIYERKEERIFEEFTKFSISFCCMTHLYKEENIDNIYTV